ncbi:hypothetical protein D8674_021011 [Pyrus ussuriensis x Pyrus communis]|uniref:NAD(P)H dehydrogenase (quinone) n=1 Tax=Pyrus ussuriensis x Pyrus communis TaxID=2448454 RepID=A0A5N5HLA0_9ROSA|nr:hypothetical protein D8674_021011 [Pyrus ussuriensis x Pyrus communis]
MEDSASGKSLIRVEVGHQDQAPPLFSCFCVFGPCGSPFATKKNKNSLIKVLAVCGSLRKASYNRGLIRYAIELSKTSISGLEIEYVDISELPFLNTDLQGEKDKSFPPAVETFRQKILEADSIFFASSEYNYSISVVSASGDFGGGQAQYHLRQVGVSVDLHFINKPEFFLNGLQHNPPKFDRDGNVIDEQAKENLKEVLLSLQSFTLRLQKK